MTSLGAKSANDHCSATMPANADRAWRQIDTLWQGDSHIPKTKRPHKSIIFENQHVTASLAAFFL
jgi:hypothetical protein